MHSQERSLRIATWNVLADACTEYGDYKHAPIGLMEKGARIQPIVALATRLATDDNLRADVIGLQEVEEPLVDALDATGLWQTFWSPKQNASDGCLTLVRRGIKVGKFETSHFQDDSGHVMQLLKIGRVAIRNSHLKFDMQNRVAEAYELLDTVVGVHRAVLFGDFNDRPGEPVRRLLANAGFANVWGDELTAYIANREGPAALDILAVRGLPATPIAVNLGDGFTLREIPSERCPSDHIPIMAEVAF